MRPGLSASIVALLLAACGGGGGKQRAPEPSPPPPVVLLPQTITFEGGGGVFERTLEQGDFSKSATGYLGTGALTWSSSDEGVATVHPTTGAVTLVGAGQAWITATIVADARYAGTSSSYVLQVPLPEGVPFDALVGSADAEVSFPPWARGHDFLRTTQADCDVARFSSCVNNQSIALTATERQVLDTTATVAREATWWLRRGTTLGAALSLSHERFPARSGAALAGLNGKLWLVAGHLANHYLGADVWSSTDGVFWTRVVIESGFPARTRARLLAFDGRLWLIGGNGAAPGSTDVPLGDVWSSSDGITWREETANAPFGGRFDHAAVVFEDRMWVIGGARLGATPRANDVWWSTNGIDWTEATSEAAFSARSGHTVSVMDGKLLLVAGDDGALLEDVWSSDDGVAWTRLTDDVPFAPRSRHVASVTPGRLCVAGGTVATPPALREMWCTANGMDWSFESGSGLVSRYDMGSAQLGDRWYFAGGEFAPGTPMPQGGMEFHYTDEVDSWDGSIFRRHTPHARWFTGTPNLLAKDDRLFVVGHDDGLRVHPFVYISENGNHWEHAPRPEPQPWERHGGAYAVHGDRLFVVSGGVRLGDGELVRLDDVWASEDGGTWTAAALGAAFGGRTGHAVASLDGKLFVIGGYNGAIYLNDVFTSTNGVQWTSATANAAFTARAEHRVVAFNGRLWLYGGTGVSGRRSDVWSSADGIIWQLESAFVPYVGYEGVSFTVHDERVWMTGGRYYEPAFRDYAYASEVYVSGDGVSFSRVDIVPRIYSARANAGFASAGGRLWVVGGRDRFSQRSDVWSSLDGIHWRQHVSGLMPYPMPAAPLP